MFSGGVLIRGLKPAENPGHPGPPFRFGGAESPTSNRRLLLRGGMSTKKAKISKISLTKNRYLK
jgi:hypothetical protein